MKASVLCGPFGGLIAFGLLAALGTASADVRTWVAPAERESVAFPIRLHPDNPHYFLWRGKPTVLITSGEHYGAVMNFG